MSHRQLLGLIGSTVLFLGCFCPIISAPIVGSMNYFQNGKGDGAIVLMLAVMSLALTLLGRYKILWFTALASAALLLHTFINFQRGMSVLAKESQSEPFAGLAEGMAQTIQLQWGFALLVIGVVILIVCAAKNTNENDEKSKSLFPCSGCGKKIHITAPACPHCGAPNSQQSVESSSINPKKHNYTVFLKVLVILATIGIVSNIAIRIYPKIQIALKRKETQNMIERENNIAAIVAGRPISDLETVINDFRVSQISAEKIAEKYKESLVFVISTTFINIEANYDYNNEQLEITFNRGTSFDRLYAEQKLLQSDGNYKMLLCNLRFKKPYKLGKSLFRGPLSEEWKDELAYLGIGVLAIVKMEPVPNKYQPSGYITNDYYTGSSDSYTNHELNVKPEAIYVYDEENGTIIDKIFFP
ncbi:MAG: zinc ribbon domain-containing protein [Holophagales bacterium]|jgi:hypothetical protein|nr:zinc ribbon domain-containing protein [Holophagales bacterium]